MEAMPSRNVELKGKKNLRKKNFMRIDLRFHERTIEKAYKIFILGFQQKYFLFFQFAVLLVLTTNWIINPLDLDNFSGRSLILSLLQIILHSLATIYLSYKKDFKYPELGIFILQIYTCVGYIESTFQKNFKMFSRTNYITTTTLLEMNSLASMISRSSWKTNFVSSLLLNTYLCLRYADLKDNQEMRGLPSMVFLTNFLVMSLGSYFHERYDRELFFQRFNSEQSLKRFEEIIREVLPSSILIYKEEELLFFNEEARRMFKLNDSMTLEKKVKEIMITSLENQDTEEKKIGGYELITERENCLNEIKDDNNNLLLYFSRLKSCKKKEGFTRLTGIIGNSNKENFSGGGGAGGNLSENETKYLEIKIGRLLWEGYEAHMVILTEDFAMHKLKYAQEQVKYKDRLLATVSHDLRTPLNGVIGIIDLVLESISDKEVRKSLHVALHSSNLLLFMINDILDFSQISNGRLNLAPVQFSLEDKILDVTKLIKFQAKKKGIALEVQNKLPRNEKKFLIYSDPNRLKQVVLNLLGNALKFTEKGFVRITFAIDQSHDEIITDGTLPPVRITVEDSGCGIKREDFHKLFKLFGMANNPESEKINTTGVGLGLAISQNLVRILNNHRLGGEITVESEYRKGSSFSFLLHNFKESGSNPNNENKERSTLTHLESTREEDIFYSFNEREKQIVHVSSPSNNYFIFKNLKKKLKVLLVDDDQINIIVLTTFFEKFDDCEFLTASNGKEALDIVINKAKQKVYFDIIFMDCNMPVMDGFMATKSILKLVSDDEIPNLVIIASTANASEMDREKCLKFGMIDFLTKPFTIRALREKIDKYMKK